MPTPTKRRRPYSVHFTPPRLRRTMRARARGRTTNLLLPSMLARAPRSHYSIEETNRWTYRDHAPGPGVVANLLPPESSYAPHFVLRDKNGMARYTLRYEQYENRLIVNAIQGVRQQYVPSAEHHSVTRITSAWRYSEEREKVATNEFKKELGGVFPGEFLFAWFLWQQREKIKNGVKVQLAITRKNMAAYGPIIDRYFSKPEEYKDKGKVFFFFDLNLNKKRVRDVLALP